MLTIVDVSVLLGVFVLAYIAASLLDDRFIAIENILMAMLRDYIWR